MWFRFKRQAVPSRQAVPKPAARPSRLTPPKRRGRVSLVLETLEDRFAPATLMQTFYPPEPFATETGSGFGAATATSADFHVVSMPGAEIDGVANRGAAFVYSATTGALIATLVNPSSANFGFGAQSWLSLSGNIVVVGARYGAYVFEATTGALIATLNAPSPFGGESVSISGNTVVIGAYNTTDGGQAYVFDATTGTLVATLANPSPASGDRFAQSVAISGNVVVVGAPGDVAGTTDSGQAYVFDATTGALLVTLANPSPASGDQFGRSLAISGNRVVVGAPYDDTGAIDSGQAYVFDATTGTLIATLANPSPTDGDTFSYLGVAVSGNTVAIAAPGNTYDPSSSSARIGHVSIFDATTGVLLDTIPNPANGLGDGFGRVSIWNNTVLVGAPYNDTQNTDQGAAYVYNLGPVSGAPPVVTSVAPFSGPTTGGTIVVITGTNFDGATAVAFGPNSATSFTVNSATQITATAPAAAGVGVVDIVVTTPEGSSATAGTADDFTYVLPAPKLGSLMPNGGEMYARNAYGIQVAGLAGNNSIIAQLFVTFDIGVTLAPGAFTLDAGNVAVNTAGGVDPVPQGTNVVGIIAEPAPNSLDANGGFKSYRLRFSGSSTYLNSFDNSPTGNGGLGNSFTTLKDGFYTLNINGANVHAGNSVAGTPMVGNARQSFWTMYASVAADDRSVSTTPGDGSSAIGVNSSLIDFAKTNGDGYGGGILADYNVNFDWNLDGDVRDDVIEFAKRFGAEWAF